MLVSEVTRAGFSTAGVFTKRLVRTQRRGVYKSTKNSQYELAITFQQAGGPFEPSDRTRPNHANGVETDFLTNRLWIIPPPRIPRENPTHAKLRIHQRAAGCVRILAFEAGAPHGHSWPRWVKSNEGWLRLEVDSPRTCYAIPHR